MLLMAATQHACAVESIRACQALLKLGAPHMQACPTDLASLWGMPAYVVSDTETGDGPLHAVAVLLNSVGECTSVAILPHSC